MNRNHVIIKTKLTIKVDRWELQQMNSEIIHKTSSKYIYFLIKHGFINEHKKKLVRCKQIQTCSQSVVAKCLFIYFYLSFKDSDVASPVSAGSLFHSFGL